MLRITRETDYGVVLLTRLAVSEGGVMNARDLSTDTHIPLPTVSKILKTLARTKMLESIRGAKGGYRLARPAAEISIAEIIRAIEGPIALTECVEQTDCEHHERCPVQGNWNRINRAIQETLANISLLEMTKPDQPSSIPSTMYV